MQLDTEARLIIWGQSLQRRFEGPGDSIFPQAQDSTLRVMMFSGEKNHLTDEQFTHAVLMARARLKNHFSQKAEAAARLVLVGRKRKTLQHAARELGTDSKSVRRWRNIVLNQHKINMGFKGPRNQSGPKQTKTPRGPCYTESLISAQVQKAIDVMALLPDGPRMVVALSWKYAREAIDADAAREMKIPIRSYQQLIHNSRIYIAGYFAHAAA